MFNELDNTNNMKSTSIDSYRQANMKCILRMVSYDFPRIFPGSIEMIKKMQKNINAPSLNKKY